MKICCCSLAGTSSCYNCINNHTHTIGHIDFTPYSPQHVSMINTPKQTLKEKFIEEYKSKNGKIKYMVIAELTISDTIDIITHTERLDNKFDYYVDMYHDDFSFKNNSTRKIVNFMIV